MLDLPNITDESLDDKKERRQIKDYLYQLTEQLRYTLNNLGEENFTEDFKSTVLTGKDGATAMLELTTQGLMMRMTDAESNIASIQFTAQGLDIAVKKQKLSFGESGLTIKNGGFQIVDSSGTTVCQANTDGTVKMTGEITASKGTIGGWSLSDDGLSNDTSWIKPNDIKLNDLHLSKRDESDRIYLYYDSDKSSDPAWVIGGRNYYFLSAPRIRIETNSESFDMLGGKIHFGGTDILFNGVPLATGRIEKGVDVISGSGTEIMFSKAFSSPPIVVMTAVGAGNGAIAPRISSITNSSFSAIIGGSSSSFQCNWIAIGQ